MTGPHRSMTALVPYSPHACDRMHISGSDPTQVEAKTSLPGPGATPDPTAPKPTPARHVVLQEEPEPRVNPAMAGPKV